MTISAAGHNTLMSRHLVASSMPKNGGGISQCRSASHRAPSPYRSREISETGKDEEGGMINREHGVQ